MRDVERRNPRAVMSRRGMLAALSALALLPLVGLSTRNTLDRAMRHVALALGLDSIARRMRGASFDDQRPADLLLIAVCNLSPEGALAHSGRALRARVRALVVADYLEGRIEQHDGWWLSATEVRAIALANRVPGLPT